MSALLIVVMLAACAHERHGYKEKDYQRSWCKKHNGQTEVVLDDRTRVDCLTADYAIEFDFGHKWAEATGQSLYYAIKTKRKPGVVLILKDSSEERYYKRIRLISDAYGIKLWKMNPSDLD